MKKNLLLVALLAATLFSNAQVNQADKALALDLAGKNSLKIGLQPGDLDNSIIAGTYIIDGSSFRMVYLQQSYKGIPVYNRLYVLAFRNEELVSVAGSRLSSMDQKTAGYTGVPGIDPVKAVKTALKEAKTSSIETIAPISISSEGRKFEFGSLGVSSENINAELLWFPAEEGNTVKLVWQVFVAPLNSSAYWLIRVDATTNKVISKEDLTISCNWGKEEHTENVAIKKQDRFNYVLKREDKREWEYKPFVVNSAIYRVVRYPAESPQHPGGTPITHLNPWTMSPGNATTLGWHNDGSIFYDSTRGNNAFAYDDRDANNLPGRSGLSTTPQPDLTFDFVPDFTMEPVIRTPAPNQQFNTTNLFYWNNLMHDLSYLYGFTETARNYQNSNMGRGGAQGDYVLAEAQDGSGTNNANFSPGADGTRGRMQMYLWPTPTPDKDGDADNGVIAHEYTHGISNRMTGTGVGCLNTIEQMGEGWSDYLGLMITHNWATAVPTDGFNNPRGIGTYVLNQPVNGVGIRQYRYTTNMAINPMTYANLPTVAVPHGVGTIWCTALWDMTWFIIQQTGVINPNLFDPSGAGGNSVALKLVIEGLRLQPCGPGFIDGRNAILKADTMFFGAQYSCAIIEAFARRGMGIGASQGSPNVRGDETITFVNGKAVFTTQPQSASVCVGSNQIFTVVTTGINVTYQWQLSINGGANFNDIAGATAATYTVNSVTAGMNNYQYRCIATGCQPPTISNVAILTVTSPPSITTQPTDLSVCEPAPASFSVVASGAGTLYQWQLSTDGGANYNNIPGATNATLNLGPSTASMNNNRYRCLISNAGCTTPVASVGAILTVNTAPVITNQPADASQCLGSSYSLCVTATGSNLIYLWQSAPTCAGPWTNLPVPSSSCLTLTATVTTSYRCVITGICGSPLTTNCATITVINPIAITNQPVNKDVCSGSNTSFSVTATSQQTISYQWQVSTNGGSSWTNISNTGVYSGATSANLNITGATTSMSGYLYRSQLSSSACTTPVSSSAVLLTVHQLPTIGLTASLLSLLPGQLSTLTATPSASTGGVVSVSWFYNSNPLANTGNTYIANVEKIGTYQVMVQELWPGGVACVNQSTTVVINATVSNKLFIFPSPNDGRFTVSYYNNGGANSTRRIVIFSSKGKKVYDRQFPITGPYTLLNIDLRAAATGIYFVVVGDAAGNKLAEGKVHVH